VQHAIEPEEAGLLVELVLHLGALGDLDHAAEVVLDAIAELHVVPRVHAESIAARGAQRSRAAGRHLTIV